MPEATGDDVSGHPSDQVAWRIARARVRITSALTSLALDGLGPAMAELDLARREARDLGDSLLSSRCDLQEAALHVWCAQWPEAIDAIDRVRPFLAELPPNEQCAALLNGGLAHISWGSLESGRRDLEQALALAGTHGLVNQAFKAQHNLGCLRYIEGDIPGALSLLRRARDLGGAVNSTRTDLDLAQVLLEAGLVTEAEHLLKSALAQARAEEQGVEVGDLHLDLARCALVVDDLALAHEHADAAAGAFTERGARGRATSARLVAALAELVSGHPATDTTQLWLLIEDAVAGPTDVGVAGQACRVAAELKLSEGDHDGARAWLGRLEQLSGLGLGDAAHAALLRARLAGAEGRDEAAATALAGAAGLVSTRQGASSSLEVRAGLALHARRLREEDLRRAHRRAEVSDVVDTAERWRASSLRLPLSVGTHPEVAGPLEDLRRLRQRLAITPPSDEGREELEHEARLLSERVSALGREMAVDQPVADRAPVRLTDLRSSTLLADGLTTCCFHASDGRLFRVDVSDSGCQVHDLGPRDPLRASAARAQQDLTDLAHAGHEPRIAALVRAALERTLAELEARLLGDLRLERSAPVAIVPTEELLLVPWRAFTALRGRAVVIAPSLTHLLGEVEDHSSGQGVTLSVLAGPGLTHAVSEVEAVAHAWRGRETVLRSAATAADLRAALVSSQVVHVAAHGHHEPQSPLLSSLTLADGPAFAHELAAGGDTGHVVLSACDVGRAEVLAGDEPLGLVAALWSRGVGSVVASVAPVDDAVVARAMPDYHRHLASGRPASHALLEACGDDPALATFAVFGRDWRLEQPTPQMKSAGSRNNAS